MATLENEIACLKSNIARLRIERTTLAKSLNRLVRYHLYHRFLRWFRSPEETLPRYRLMVFAIGPLATGALSMIAINEAYEFWSYAIVAFLVGSLSSAFAFAFLLFKPPSEVLPRVIADGEIERNIWQSKLNNVDARLHSANARLKYLLREMRRLIDSGRLQRELLLQRNWKAMRDEEWENFLADVFHTLGAKVEKTGRSGDQGVDLVVEFGGRRIAVQAKGYYHAVSGKAVQEAVAGVAYYGCNASAVFTNSRFTKAAKELAASNRCILISEEEFPDFVLGKLAI